MPAIRLAVVVAWSVAASLAQAQSDPSAIAASLPIEVQEVAAGGVWIDGDASGTYRTITIQGAIVPEVSQIYLQWVGSRSPVEPLQILSSVPLREYNVKELSSPSVAIDPIEEGRIRIAITGQDTNAKSETVTFQATLPGQYTLVAGESARAQK